MLNLKDRIGEPALYELAAEEATELAHACLKMARILRDENPTPAVDQEVLTDIKEEYVDLDICLQELGIPLDTAVKSYKLMRCQRRLKEAGK